MRMRVDRLFVTVAPASGSEWRQSTRNFTLGRSLDVGEVALDPFAFDQQSRDVSTPEAPKCNRNRENDPHREFVQ